jgi:hypothetical protein
MTETARIEGGGGALDGREAIGPATWSAIRAVAFDPTEDARP